MNLRMALLPLLPSTHCTGGRRAKMFRVEGRETPGRVMPQRALVRATGRRGASG